MVDESADESDDEWRFSVDEFDDPPGRGEPADPDPSVDGTPQGEEASDDSEGNVAGEFAPQVPVVPERPDAENAAFVTLGAVLTILALASVFSGPSFGLVDALLVVAVVGGLGALAYGALVRLTPET